jgi:hypothetical protein
MMEERRNRNSRTVPEPTASASIGEGDEEDEDDDEEDVQHATCVQVEFESEDAGEVTPTCSVLEEEEDDDVVVVGGQVVNVFVPARRTSNRDDGFGSKESSHNGDLMDDDVWLDRRPSRDALSEE